MPEISICVGTAHSDHAMLGNPKMHIFKYLTKSLREQTFKDFELVLTDTLYEQRKDYFKKFPEDFVVKHVPVKPNIWMPQGYCAIATTKNTSLLHAEGKIVVYTGDCSSLPPNFLKTIVEKIRSNRCIANTYEIYSGRKQVFKDRRAPGIVQGTYGNVSLYMKDALELNGYNEMFDGSKGLEDCDFGRRMYSKGMIIELIDLPVRYQQHKGDFPTLEAQPLKCPRLMEMMSCDRSRIKIYKANSVPYTEKEIDRLLECSEISKGHFCKYVRDINGDSIECRSGLNQDGKAKYSDVVKIRFMYNHPSLIFDLKEQKKSINKALFDLDKLCQDVGARYAKS